MSRNDAVRRMHGIGEVLSLRGFDGMILAIQLIAAFLAGGAFFVYLNWKRQ